MLKEEIRILGFDEGPFENRTKGKVIVIGVVFRGGKVLDGLLRTDVTIDGLDATENLIKLINSSRHKEQLKVVMLDGITLGGFNLVDIKKLSAQTNLPVIAISRKIPNMNEIKKALKNFKDFETRWQIVKKAGKVKKCPLREGKVLFYQNVGVTEEEAEEIIQLSCTRAFYPEPLRVAHIIATGIVKGESYGGA
ncbi:MAG: DUF99 family protein [Candidatus Aenigmatarchaeota archaeon]